MSGPGPVVTVLEEVGLIDWPTPYQECGYFRRCQGEPGYEEAICSFGCYDEPACITSFSLDEAFLYPEPLQP